MTIEQILTGHEYSRGVVNYCTCGEPLSWHWSDWVAHVTPILDEYMNEPVSNMPPRMRLRLKRAQEQE